MTNYDVMRETEGDPERLPEPILPAELEPYRKELKLSPNSVFVAWAIRDKLSGAFMPMCWKRGMHHYSYDLPIAGAFPRLFPTRISAQNALNAWLAGTWKTDWEEEYEEGYRIGGYRTEPLVVNTGAELGRKKEDMEIVRMVLETEKEATS